MKFKQFLSIALALFLMFSLLTACGKENTAQKKENQPKTIKSTPDVPINPDLVSAFGKEMIEGEKETIRTIVTGLHACYKRHLKDKNVYFFIKNVENFMMPYDEYLDEIGEDLKGLYAAAEGNSNKMLELMGMQSALLAIATDKLVWSSFISMLDDGMDPGSTELEAEEAVINYINGISEFFYGGKIIK